MINKKLLYILIPGLIFFYSCSETMTSNEDGDDDPNNEEELLLTFGEDEVAGKVKVMSRNVYVGTDVTSLLGETSLLEIPSAVQAAFNQLEDTDFPERAETLAAEIEKTLPHLIGLQEVAHVFYQSPGDFLAGNPQSASTEIYDYLEILMDALAARGLNYSVAAVISNADIELPILPTSYSEPGSFLDDIRLVDRDVILVRNDVAFSNVTSAHYTARIIIDETLDISVPRGYVAVDAAIDGNNYRFANTHLESFDLDQSLRTAQLAELLEVLENETIPVILAGDFNFSPSSSFYQTAAQNGYEDARAGNTFTYNANGYTYGHDSDLQNSTSSFSARIDYIFVKSSGAFSFEESFVVGDELRDRTPSKLWPSDHGGVVSKINFN